MKRTLSIVGIIVLLLIHIGLVFRSYPLDVFSDGEIPLKGDIARHFATAHGSAECGGLYGYDPYFMAGYPVGLWNSMGKKGYELAHLALPGVGLPRLFYGVIVVLCLLNPILLWAALRSHAGSKRVSAILFVLVILFWQLGSQVSYFWNFGNIFFPAAACWIVMMCAATQQILLGRRTVLNMIWLGLLATAVLYCHSVALVAAAIALAVLVLVHGIKNLKTSQVACLLAAVFICLALSAAWLCPLLLSRADCLGQPKLWFQGGPKHLVMDVFSDRAYQHHFDRNFLYQFAIVVGCAGLVASWKKDSSRFAAALGIGAIAVLVLTYLGHLVPPIRAIQPYRFTIPAMILLLLPAARGVDLGLRVFSEAGRKDRLLVLVVIALLLPRFSAYLIDLSWPPDRPGITEPRQAVIEAVREMEIKGRLLCDDIGLGHILPYTCEVPVLSGLSSQAFLHHRFAGMDEEGILFGRRPGAWDGAKLTEYLRAYAVEYAIFSSRPWLSLAARSDSPFERMQRVGGHTIFKVRDADVDYVLEGEAVVSADHNMIAVSEASGSLLLSFHYAEWLSAGEGVTLVPETVLDDPVPFIRATPGSGARDFVITKH